MSWQLRIDVSLVGETSKLKDDINKAFEEADRASAKAGKKIGENLGAGMAGSKNPAAKAGEEAAREYERSLKASIRGEKLGEAIGKPIGKGIGLAIKGGIAVAATGATAAVGLLATSLTKGFARLRNIDNARFKLQALGNSASDVDAIMKSALASVKGTAFGLDEAATTAAGAVAAQVQKGEELTQYLTTVADAAAIAGTSLEEMGAIFNKVQTSGKAMTDDLNMLGDRGIPIFKWLQDATKTYGEEFNKLVERGGINAQLFRDTIANNIGGAAQKMGESFEGALSNMNAALGRFGASLINSALGGDGLDGPTSGINKLTESLDKLDAWVNRNQGEIIGFFGELVDGASGATRMMLNFAAETVGAIAVIWNAINDMFGGMAKVGAKIYEFLGMDEEAKEWREWSEELFGAADGLYKVKEGLKEAAVEADKFGNRYRASMDAAATKATAFRDLVEDVGTKIEQIPGTREFKLVDNTAEAIEKIDQTKYAIETLPDGTVKIIPLTEEAQGKIDAFLTANDPTPPIDVALDVDVTQADAEMRAFRQRWEQFFRTAAAVPGAPTEGLGPPAIPPGYRQGPGTQPGTLPGVQVPDIAPPSGGDGYILYDPSRPGGLGRVAGRASGGPITGPGPKGKDSVLMWGAPGEHVLTDKEVDALGGQAEVYRLRAAIRAGWRPKGYDEGGTVEDLLFGRKAPRADIFDPVNVMAIHGIIGAAASKPTRGNFNPAMLLDTSHVSVDQMGYFPGVDTSSWRYGDLSSVLTKHRHPDRIRSEVQERRRADRQWLIENDPLWNYVTGGQDPYDTWFFSRGGAIPGYENGGAVGAINAIDTAYANAGKPYQYGPWDCSMYLSHIYAAMAGLPPGRYFTTESDFEALGFKRGYKPGALNIGIRRGGGGRNSHMAGTLPNGVNVENTGSGSMYGEGAAGANDFPIQYYYEPPNSGDMGALQTQTAAQNGLMAGTGGAGPIPGVGGGASDVQAGAAGPMDSGPARTEGWIPAAAGSTSVAGTSFVSGLLGMGAEAINGLIDQGAAAASSAVSAAITAGVAGGTMGAGAAGAPAAGAAGSAAAQFAIGLGANAAKRGVKWGADMLGIGADAALEIFSPFGLPRWLGYDYTQFVPHLQIDPALTTTAEMVGSAVDPNTTEHGAGRGAPPGPPQPQVPQGPQPPQPYLPEPDHSALQPQPPGIQIGEINGMDPAMVSDELLKLQQLNMMQYAGRP